MWCCSAVRCGVRVSLMPVGKCHVDSAPAQLAGATHTHTSHKHKHGISFQTRSWLFHIRNVARCDLRDDTQPGGARARCSGRPSDEGHLWGIELSPHSLLATVTHLARLSIIIRRISSALRPRSRGVANRAIVRYGARDAGSMWASI